MSKKFTQTKLLVASGNTGKIKEIQDFLSSYNIEIISAKEFSLKEPEENGKDFIANAKIKAQYYAHKTNIPALADDSGLCVDALGGLPGIYSARWAGQDKNFTAAAKRIKDELGDSKNYKAHFTCALALYWPDDKHFETVEGFSYGKVSFPGRGEKGFGYDPIFIPDNYDQTYAELDKVVKHTISHRADAFSKLIKLCF